MSLAGWAPPVEAGGAASSPPARRGCMPRANQRHPPPLPPVARLGVGGRNRQNENGGQGEFCHDGGRVGGACGAGRAGVDARAAAMPKAEAARQGAGRVVGPLVGLPTRSPSL